MYPRMIVAAKSEGNKGGVLQEDRRQGALKANGPHLLQYNRPGRIPNEQDSSSTVQLRGLHHLRSRGRKAQRTDRKYGLPGYVGAGNGVGLHQQAESYPRANIKSRAFGVSILDEETPMQFIGRFGFKSGRDSEKLEGINYKFGQTRSPIVLDHATSYMDCELVTSMDAGTHTIFLGRVVDADVVSDGRPMTYEHYHRVKGGKSPKTAPTYAGPAEDEKPSKMEGKSMTSYKCTICGYVYDPAEGAPDVGIAAGTAFEDLPDSWVCPICGASKTEFEKAG